MSEMPVTNIVIDTVLDTIFPPDVLSIVKVGEETFYQYVTPKAEDFENDLIDFNCESLDWDIKKFTDLEILDSNELVIRIRKTKVVEQEYCGTFEIYCTL